jgi:hypothetical protein
MVASKPTRISGCLIAPVYLRWRQESASSVRTVNPPFTPHRPFKNILSEVGVFLVHINYHVRTTQITTIHHKFTTICVPKTTANSPYPHTLTLSAFRSRHAFRFFKCKIRIRQFHKHRRPVRTKSFGRQAQGGRVSGGDCDAAVYDPNHKTSQIASILSKRTAPRSARVSLWSF